MKAFPLQSGTRQEWLLLLDFILEVLVSATRKKEINLIIGKEETNLSLFIYKMISYVENSKISTDKLLELIGELNKVTECIVNKQK